MEKELIIHFLNVVEEYLSGDRNEKESLDWKEKLSGLLFSNVVYKDMGWQESCGKFLIGDEPGEKNISPAEMKQSISKWYPVACKEACEAVISFTEILYAYEMGYKEVSVLAEVFDLPESFMAGCLKHYGFDDVDI